MKSVGGFLTVFALFAIGLGLGMWRHRDATAERLDVATIMAPRCGPHAAAAAPVSPHEGHPDDDVVAAAIIDK
ncbi:MAG TPA: hypothetical protein VFM56_03100 [Solimonas sp.]|nr:hypothetical protein [Solimonas sp.]